MTEMLELAPQLNTNAVVGLFDDLTRLRGKDVAVKAGKVIFVGGLCFQLLVAARKQWCADGRKFDLKVTSAEFETGMALLGLPIDSFHKSPIA